MSAESLDGFWVLNKTSVNYADGGENSVLEILKAATDLSSTSDALVAHAQTWAEQYHLSPARSNVLRPVTLSKTDRVLEIGAGCGAITRYLGEQCLLVDALEPMVDRARCARERTRDLENVEVFVGVLEDVPEVESYDVVVVMGVLEYIANGGSDHATYQDFLARVSRHINPGGCLILGIENKLGVKYLVGAPEDHSSQQFETIQGYFASSPARTFSRRELQSMMTQVGLRVETIGLFPDYKLTRAALHDDIYEKEPELAKSLPIFPSPDWSVQMQRVASEARAWATLVDAGLGSETSNSLLFIGQKEGGSPRWTEGQLAAFYSPPNRKTRYATESVVRAGDHGEMFTARCSRRRLREDLEQKGMVLPAGDAPIFHGQNIQQVILFSETTEELRSILTLWRAGLDAAIAEGRLPRQDLLPHNAILTPGNDVVFVDSKWNFEVTSRSSVLQRSALHLAIWMCANAATFPWPAKTVRELALYLGSLMEVDPEPDWIDHAIDAEVELQCNVSIKKQYQTEDVSQKDSLRQELAWIMDRQLVASSEIVPNALLERAQRESRNQVRLNEELAKLQSQIAALQDEISSLYQSKTFRLLRIPRSIYGRLLSRSR